LGNLSAVGPVVHKQQFNVFLASDQKLSETTGQHVSGLGSLLLTDLWHLAPTFVATALGVVDTSGTSPRLLDTHKLVHKRPNVLVPDPAPNHNRCVVNISRWRAQIGVRV